jgi:hypothetical protein
VNWSQKEESDDDLQRINLDKSREIKQLKDEFSDLIDEAKEEQRLEEERAKKLQQPPAPIVPPGTPPAATTPPATSGGLP